ncbi:MAG: SDR family NAD(P)-dependent oxidoreductase [Actinobacteria bacterium]|nr:MAG: SDR family NAD(P)-dependent oxidoreductase [Actinomycetota bacterium]
MGSRNEVLQSGATGFAAGHACGGRWKGTPLVEFRGKAVAITGAASGIGREIARAFAQRGADLALADIDGEGLLRVEEELRSRGCKVYTQVVDVSVSRDMEDFRDRVYTEMGRVDILCNNAGVAVGGRLEDISLADWEWILGIDLWGVIYGCHYFYPRMIQQGGGHIVNVASNAGLFPSPGVAPYSAAKYGVVGFSETLRAEAALHGINVSVVCPGLVATSITRTARISSGSRTMGPQELLQTMDRFYQRYTHTPESVARAVVRGVERNRGVILVGAESYLMDILHRLSRRFFDLLIRAITWFVFERM